MTTPLRPVLLTRPVAWKDRAEFATRASMGKDDEKQGSSRRSYDLMPGGKTRPERRWLLAVAKRHSETKRQMFDIEILHF
eukprot:scaffold13141_cov58-Phaeocystis_antarctica.AAC.2